MSKNVLERMKENDSEHKIAMFKVKQQQDYTFKRKYARIRAWEFYNHPEIDGMAYVAVGGLDSITLHVFLRSIGIRVPAISVSSLEDKSIQWVHKALGVKSIPPAKREDGKYWSKREVIRQFGFPIISKETAGKISLLQHPSPDNATVRHAIITGETGEYGGFRTGTRMQLAKRWLDLFGGPENEKEGTHYKTAPFLVSDKCCYYLHANIDRRVLGERSGLECKTASALNLKTYAGGEFPDSYYVQCVTYLTVTSWERWYLAVLILGKGFQIYQITTVENDAVPEWCESSVYVSQAEMDALKSGAKRFWETYVLPDQAPPADGAEATGDAISTIYSEDGGGEVQLFGRESMLQEYFYIDSKIKELQKDMETIKQTIQQDMGDAPEAACTGYSVTWKSQSRATFDAKQFAKDHPHMDLSAYYKTSKFRVFKIKEDKAG